MHTENADATHNQPDPLAWLREHREKTQREHAAATRAEHVGTTARLASFLAAIAAMYFLRHTPWLGVTAAAAMLVVFGWTVCRHREVKARRELIDRVLLVIDESVRRCTEWLSLIRSGSRPMDPKNKAADVDTLLEPGRTSSLTEQEFDDLDVYAAPIGLFGLLNRTSTPIGARRLRDLVEHPLIDRARLGRRRETVQWLEQHAPERLRIMAAAAILRENDQMLSKVVLAFRNAEALPNSTLILLLRVWALPSALITVWAVFCIGRGELAWAYGLFALILLNGSLYAVMRKALEGALAPWRNIAPALEGYAHVAFEAAAVLPQEGELDKIRHGLATVADPAVAPALCRRIKWSESGGIMHTICNIVFFFDVHVAEMILHTALPHRDALLSGLAGTADIEALCSLATYAFESRAGGSVCYPRLSDRVQIEVVNGRHPLILPDEAIGNDAALSEDTRLWVVTGPNMAGKSTFLRMVGINMLLGQVGTAVTADAMTMAPMRLITDLQARDNLSRHESYFLAEVRQLRRMVKPDEDGAPILGLIDEPFRGTNSQEQVAATLAVVEHLLRLPHLFLVATHEHRLTKLADEREAARNFHFHEELGEKGMVFDYRIRPGPAVTRNALDVLVREQYPSELVDDARRRLGEDGPGDGES
ncbi:MAG: hypothetical protein IH987_09155 [Planctomycetes bacterium]|nr:hypothetical protein [Planctomycetota bacterium]